MTSLGCRWPIACDYPSSKACVEGRCSGLRYYIVVCRTCASPLPQPFSRWEELQRWVREHHDATRHPMVIDSVFLDQLEDGE